jgi:nucleotide-binding universal stress UspA family protein
MRHDKERKMTPRIVVGSDGSAPAKAALRWAVKEAHLLGAEIDVVRAWSYPVFIDPVGGVYPLPWLYTEAEENEAKRLDADITEVLGPNPSVRINSISTCSSAPSALLEQAKNATLMVVGCHGTSDWKSVILGSTAVQVTHHAPCPVVVIHADDDGIEPIDFDPTNTDENRRRGPIVVGIDGSPASVEALKWALAEAKARNVWVSVVHTWQIPVTYATQMWVVPDIDQLQHAADSVVTATVAKATEGEDLNRLPAIHRTVKEGLPAAVLLSQSDEAELVVVGSRGHGGFVGLLLGSVATHVVNHAKCPAVVVPAPTAPK